MSVFLWIGEGRVSICTNIASARLLQTLDWRQSSPGYGQLYMNIVRRLDPRSLSSIGPLGS